jgi:hypothetical protein
MSISKSPIPIYISGQFQCGTGGECILAAYVCDGHQDCNGGIDEADCSARTLEDFSKTGRHRFDY